jgi:hypothetical protein
MTEPQRKSPSAPRGAKGALCSGLAGLEQQRLYRRARAPATFILRAIYNDERHFQGWEVSFG